MSITDDPSAPPPDAGAASPSGQPPTPGGAGGAPPGGGPVLAALARNRMAPPVSAPGPGNLANGLMMLKTAVDMLQQALPQLASGSQQHRDAVQAISRLARHLPQGAPTAGAQQTQLQDLLRNTIRNALMQKLMSQKGGQGGQGAGPPGPPDGGGGGGMPPDEAATPSTPLPGA